MRNLLFRTHDPRLYEVILHRSRYQSHIWLQHGITVEEIQSIIEAPDIITADQRDEYYDNVKLDKIYRIYRISTAEEKSCKFCESCPFYEI